MWWLTDDCGVGAGIVGKEVQAIKADDAAAHARIVGVCDVDLSVLDLVGYDRVTATV
jgi:hypothetical protein